mgnify:CR=1 FL=1
MNKDLTRREFVKLSSAGLVVGLTPALHAPVSVSQAKPLRVGFIRTGGRGTGVLGEMLRLEGSSKVTHRLCSKDIRVGNFDFKAGMKVVVSLAGADRDPARWEDPNSFRIDRPKVKEHLAFGRGALDLDHALGRHPLPLRHRLRGNAQ